MSTEIDNIQIIFDRLRLSKVRVFRDTDNNIVLLVRDSRGKLLVFKYYKFVRPTIQVEKQFLKFSQNIPFESLRLPQLIKTGDNFIILEFVPRHDWTRETILQYRWSDNDIKCWVAGLVEFQNIPFSCDFFNVKRKILGIYYPLVYFFRLWRKCYVSIPLYAWPIILCWAARYLVDAARTNRVFTHYDLQANNCALTRDKQKLSIIDFELPFYKGDQFFDIINYLMNPVCYFGRWSFQLKLWNEYVQQVIGNRNFTQGERIRIRFLFFVRSLQRILYFDGDESAREICRENMKFILSGSEFSRMFLDRK